VKLQGSQNDPRDLHGVSTAYARHARRNNARVTKEVSMLTKMKVALALCGSLLVGGIGIAAAQGSGGGGKGAAMQKYDTNKDGKLDDTERAALRADMKAKHAEMKAQMLAKYDTNKDGKLDASERAVMKNERAELAFKKLDTDGNGSISLDEFKAGKAFARHGHFHKHGRGGFGAGKAGRGQP
jgi:hypothetical protein